MEKIAKLFLAMFFILAASQSVIPGVIERGLVAAACNTFSVQESEVDVDVESLPALKLLGGSFDELQLVAMDSKIGDIKFDFLRINIKDAKINLTHLLSTGELVFKRIGYGEGEIRLSQEEVNRYLTGKLVGYIKVREVLLEDGRVTLKGAITLLGRDIPIVIKGIIAGNDRSIELIPEHLEVGGIDLAPKLKSKLLGSIIINTGFVPFNGLVKDVRADDGELVISIEYRQVE